MKISVYHGDITRAPADVACSSTNPHLELVAGTGAALREGGGWVIQEECRQIIARQMEKLKRPFAEVGSVHWTTAGTLPFRGLIQAVAIDAFHHSGAETVQSCTRGALELCAERAVTSIAMPVFASGYGDMKFENGLQLMLEVIRQWQGSYPQEIVIVTQDDERAEVAERLVASALQKVVG